MFKRPLTILIQNRARCIYLYIDYRKVVAKPVMYLARQSVALSRCGQFFDLRSVVAQQLVSLRQSSPRFTLAGCDAGEYYNEHYASAVDDCQGNRINPAAFYQKRHD